MTTYVLGQMEQVPALAVFRKQKVEAPIVCTFPDWGCPLDVECVASHPNLCFVATQEYVLACRISEHSKLQEIARTSMPFTIVPSMLSCEQSIPLRLEESILVAPSSFVVNPTHQSYLRLVSLPVEPEENHELLAACMLIGLMPLDPSSSSTSTDAETNKSIRYQVLAAYGLEQTKKGASLVALEFSSLVGCELLPCNATQRQFHRGYAIRTSDAALLQLSVRPKIRTIVSTPVLSPFASSSSSSSSSAHDQKPQGVLSLIPSTSAGSLSASSVWLEQRVLSCVDLFVVARFHFDSPSVSFALHSHTLGKVFVFPRRLPLTESLSPELMQLLQTSSSSFPLLQYQSGTVDFPDADTRSFAQTLMYQVLLRCQMQIRAHLNPILNGDELQQLLQRKVPSLAVQDTTMASEFWMRVPGDRNIYRFVYVFDSTSSASLALVRVHVVQPVLPPPLVDRPSSTIRSGSENEEEESKPFSSSSSLELQHELQQKLSAVASLLPSSPSLSVAKDKDAGLYTELFPQGSELRGMQFDASEGVMRFRALCQSPSSLKLQARTWNELSMKHFQPIATASVL